jgi:hypothetical protein
MKEYQVTRTEPGEWLNYTRVFTEGDCLVYLRSGSFGAQEVSLALVSGDIATTNQTTTELGKFSIPNQLMRLNYVYLPLLSGQTLATVHLAGTNTLRTAAQLPRAAILT